MTICTNCKKEFKNRSSEFCSISCGENFLQNLSDEESNFTSDYVIDKLISLNFKCITESESEVFEFINKIKNKEHTILLFNNARMRDTIVTEFFDKSKNNIFTACFVHNTIKYSCDKTITYNELTDNQVLLTNKISNFLIDVLDKTYPNDFPRICCEDTSWFSEAGFFEEHQKYGGEINKKIIDQSAILCCYDSSKLNPKQLNIVLDSRDFIILDDPLSVFRR